jgi:hypothetical protein
MVRSAATPRVSNHEAPLYSQPQSFGRSFSISASLGR